MAIKGKIGDKVIVSGKYFGGKKKYKAKIVGFKDDKHRIPNMDILVENNQIWKGENFEAKMTIPQPV